MTFKDKYTLDKTKEEDKDKIQLSPDAYGIADMIQELIKEIERSRTGYGR